MELNGCRNVEKKRRGWKRKPQQEDEKLQEEKQAEARRNQWGFFLFVFVFPRVQQVDQYKHS